MATTYICKCGRKVRKSTNAANTNNRDTAACKGCPYLLPWGPMEWGLNGFGQKVKGYECRMSKDIEYTTRFCGSIDDKCCCYIASLDFDFLTRVSDWIKETYPGGELNGSFFTDDIRAVEYVSNGRYRMSIGCAQNKKGIAAKAALLHQFFDASGARLDMTPEEEKAHILAAIEAGKAKAQERKENMDYIISKHVATGRLYAYYKGSFWFWDDHVKKWLLSQFAEDLYQEERPKRWNFEREHLLAQTSDFHQLDDYEVSFDCIEALLQCNPKEAIPAPASAELPEIVDECSGPSCTCSDCKRQDCTCAGGGNASDRSECDGEKNCAQDGCTYAAKHRENPTNAAEDVQQCAPTVSDAPPSPSQSANADAQQDGGDDTANPTPAAPASPAGAGAATQGLSGAEPASLEAPPSGSSAFDYSGFGDGTSALAGSCELRPFDFSELGEQLAEQAAEADKQFNLHYGKAQDEYLVSCIYLARIHELTAKAGRYGGGTWTAWYQSKGISEGSARTMVQNGDGFKSASVADLKNLPVLTKKDLNLIARNGAANQVVEAAGEGDSARIQKILNQLKAVQTERDEERKGREKAEHEAECFKKDSEDARKAAHTYHCKYEEVNAQRNALLDKQGTYVSQVTAAEQRAAEAERRAKVAEEDAAGWKQAGLEMQELVDQRDERIRELESGITVEAAAVDQEEIDRRANEISKPLVKIINRQNEEIQQLAAGNTVSAQASVLEHYLKTMESSLLSNAQRAELASYDIGALDSLARALREFADSIDGIFEDRSEDND